MNDTPRKRVLVVAAHPDDEILGCGATLARHAVRGDDVHVVIAAEGVTSRGGDVREKALAELRRAAGVAAERIGARPPVFLGFPDNRMDGEVLLDVVQAIERESRRIAPHVVYTHHGGDLNADHQVVFRAVLTAHRPLPGTETRSIYTFETPSSTEWSSGRVGHAFRPTRFVDVVETLAAKTHALQAYEMEMRTFPHPRSHEAVEALARWRGASAGVGAAEAFEVVREVR